jgi:lactoylglutathione lyase
VRVNELRMVVTVDDFEASLHLYRDVLGLREIDAVTSSEGRVAILEAGKATLELTDPEHARYIDEVEVGRRVAGHIRLALGVEDVDVATEQLVRSGAELIAAPRPTPWGSSNARLEGPGDLQLTLFGPAAG